jgi:hypothetical protein
MQNSCHSALDAESIFKNSLDSRLRGNDKNTSHKYMFFTPLPFLLILLQKTKNYKVTIISVFSVAKNFGSLK